LLLRQSTSQDRLSEDNPMATVVSLAEKNARN